MHETKICERCGTHFECKVGDVMQCHCSQVQLSDEELEYIKRSSIDCLCGDCLRKIKKTIAVKNAR